LNLTAAKIPHRTARKVCPTLGKKALWPFFSLSLFFSQEAEDRTLIRIELYNILNL
jgi:hypothetical protein